MITNHDTAGGGYTFKIGDELRLHSRQRISAAPGARYRVVGFRPPEGVEPIYRIKSVFENHERIARESELS